MLLASSEYRHALESDIEPFKGLLLGLFFIGVGMSIDFGTLVTHPLRIVILLVGFLAIKMLMLWLIARPLGVPRAQRRWFAVLLGREASSRLWSLAPRGWRMCWTANGLRR
ncbi:glutathione-regulated potassium-efflux system protein KefC [Klebsiella aerogenes]|nr:glutathione-regulated potassium-efflux system protein KefC [Klebsiella aerogenes]